MNILIVGASISGLTLANLLADTDWTVRLIDATPPVDPAPRPLCIWPHGQTILGDLALGESLHNLSVGVDHWDVLDADGQRLTTLPLGTGDTDRALRVIEGADLHHLLRDRLPDNAIEHNVAIDAIEHHEDFAHITFGDGTSERFDLVVSAEGIDSRLRSLTFDGWRIEPTHTMTLSFSSPTEAIAGPTKQLVGGSLLRFVPAQNHTLVDLTIARRHKKESGAPLDFLHTHKRDFGGILREIIESLPPRTPICVQRNRQIKAANWYHERVALIGDAAHGVAPIVEVGASMALEDARLLFEILCDKAPEHVDVALRDYAARRKIRIRRFQRTSRRARRALLDRSPVVGRGRNLLLRHTSWLDDLFVTDDSV